MIRILSQLPLATASLLVLGLAASALPAADDLRSRRASVLGDHISRLGIHERQTDSLAKLGGLRSASAANACLPPPS